MIGGKDSGLFYTLILSTKLGRVVIVGNKFLLSVDNIMRFRFCIL